MLACFNVFDKTHAYPVEKKNSICWLGRFWSLDAGLSWFKHDQLRTSLNQHPCFKPRLTSICWGNNGNTTTHIEWWIFRSQLPLWLNGRALRQQRKRLWVRFPGNTYTDKKCVTWMHCKSLWIKASAKYIHVNSFLYLHFWPCLAVMTFTHEWIMQLSRNTVKHPCFVFFESCCYHYILKKKQKKKGNRGNEAKLVFSCEVLN